MKYNKIFFTLFLIIIFFILTFIFSYIFDNLYYKNIQQNYEIDKIIKSNDKNYVKHIVTPITPYLICNHHFSSEIYKSSKKYIRYDISKIINKKTNDLYKNQNFDSIKEGDIVQVQVDLFNLFINTVLPKISCKIIIFTSQMQMPQIHRSNMTDKILNNDKIILWISQNPIYVNHNKYMAFPYGIDHRMVDKYMDFLKKNYDKTLTVDTKKNLYYNANNTIHKHLPKNHIRRHPIFNDTNYRIPYTDYLNKILNSKFTISTSGDRDDCYRHYECIGLNSIPISDIDYKEIFENNMIYSNINDIVKIINGEKYIYFYYPNKDILTIEYWRNKISYRLKNIIQ